jgi:hypothetical protein
MLPALPALYLYPLNADAFVKHINLTNNQRVKISQQTNASTVPAENNGTSIPRFRVGSMLRFGRKVAR